MLFVRLLGWILGCIAVLLLLSALVLSWTAFITAGPQGTLTQAAFWGKHLHLLSPIWYRLVAFQRGKGADRLCALWSSERLLWGRRDVHFWSGCPLFLRTGTRCSRGARALLQGFRFFQRNSFFILRFFNFLIFNFISITGILPLVVFIFSNWFL